MLGWSFIKTSSSTSLDHVSFGLTSTNGEKNWQVSLNTSIQPCSMSAPSFTCTPPFSFGVYLFNRFTELTGLVHFNHDIAPPDEFTAHVQLRNGRPLGVFFNSLSDGFVAQDVHRMVLDIETIQYLGGLMKERNWGKEEVSEETVVHSWVEDVWSKNCQSERSPKITTSPEFHLHCWHNVQCWKIHIGGTTCCPSWTARRDDSPPALQCALSLLRVFLEQSLPRT